MRQYTKSEEKTQKLCECVFIYLEMRKQVPHPKKIYKVIRHFYREFVFSSANIASLATATAARTKLFTFFVFVFGSFCFSFFSFRALKQRTPLSYPRVPHRRLTFFYFYWLGPHSGIFIFVCVCVCVWVSTRGMSYHLSATSFVAFCSFRFFENNILERKCSSWMCAHTRNKKAPTAYSRTKMEFFCGPGWAAVLRHITSQMCDLTIFKRWCS